MNAGIIYFAFSNSSWNMLRFYICHKWSVKQYLNNITPVVKDVQIYYTSHIQGNSEENCSHITKEEAIRRAASGRMIIIHRAAFLCQIAQECLLLQGCFGLQISTRMMIIHRFALNI